MMDPFKPRVDCKRFELAVGMSKEGIRMAGRSSITGSEGPKAYSYDETPYVSLPYPQTHPDRLAVLATIFGMAPQPINKARVLEIGCASGGNIIPQAYSFPESRYTGLDLSERQIADGCRTIETLGLQNIELLHLNIAEISENFGKFDYIIAHGVYSWIANSLQEKMLQVIKNCLAPNGVAYVSYNILPGWHFHGMVREMMLYHTTQFQEPQSKVAQARALLDFLHQSVPFENNAYGMMLRNEVESLRTQTDSYLLHDYLEEESSSIYFYQFVEHVTRHELQFLAESEFCSMMTTNFSGEVQGTLARISNELLRTEQYLDFLRNRSFRQTLLCHKDVSLIRNLIPKSIMTLQIACPVKPENATFDPLRKQVERFFLPDGRCLSTGGLMVRAAFHHLASIWPESASFDDLYAASRGMISRFQMVDPRLAEEDKQALTAQLLKCYAADFGLLRTQKLPFVRKVSDYPRVSDLVRYQAQRDLFKVTNQLHEIVTTDDLASQLIRLMDGTRHRSALLDEIIRLAQSGAIMIQENGTRVLDAAALRHILEQEVNGRIEMMAKTALLVG